MRPMAYELKYDEVFKADYKREMRAHPELLDRPIGENSGFDYQ